MIQSKFKFDTLQIHAGSQPDPATGARQTPIYQNTAYVFKDAAHAASLYNLQEVGYIYSRLTNPTVSVLQERVATLEGGIGGIACSSGHAAQILALFPLMQPGDNIIASNRLYGGSINQLENMIRKFGWSAKFSDFENLKQLESLVDENTKAIFCESISNPGGYVTDIPAVSAKAKKFGIPLIVDNTAATPFLFRPFEHGADIVTHSTTKYLSGNGTSMGGLVIDHGTFNWSESNKFPSLTQPEKGYHGLKFHETFGYLGYTLYGIAVSLRDLGMSMAPQNAFQTLLGIETLSLRMSKHVSNAESLASWLENDDRVGEVHYAGLDSSPYASRVKSLYPKGAGALFTFTIKGGYEPCVRFVNSVEIFSHVSNLGDSRSLVIHPASTTHRQLSEEHQKSAGAGPNIIRLSVGIEDATDLINDLDQALTLAVA